MTTTLSSKTAALELVSVPSDSYRYYVGARQLRERRVTTKLGAWVLEWVYTTLYRWHIKRAFLWRERSDRAYR